MTSKPLGHFVSCIQHTSMCSFLRSTLNWPRFVADERPLTLNVPMVMFERDRDPFSGITDDRRKLLLMALLMCICTVHAHPFRRDRQTLASIQTSEDYIRGDIITVGKAQCGNE